ncbi:two component sensor histidine kinase domain protein, partial [Vibrio parahaemolyticus V-223/04]
PRYQTSWNLTPIGAKLRHQVGCSRSNLQAFMNTCWAKRISTL